MFRAAITLAPVLTGVCALLFFFNDTATTEIYTLSLHDALPISRSPVWPRSTPGGSTLSPIGSSGTDRRQRRADRKSTRLNSSHITISYAVFCLKKKKKKNAFSDYRSHLAGSDRLAEIASRISYQ